MKQFFKFTFASCLGFFLSSVIICFLSAFLVWGCVLAVSSEKTEVKDNSILHICLNGVLVERSKENPFYSYFSENSEEIALSDVLSAIKMAKTDDKIRGIYLEAGVLSSGNASIEEIRGALRNFKSSGKFVVAYGGMFSQNVYYLTTVADKIFINPSGSIDLRGLAVTPVFFKNIFEKLGIKIQIAKVGEYKGATETYSRSEMSTENKEQTMALLHSTWDNVSLGIATDRKISKEKINAYAEESMFFQPPTKYVQYGLVDGLFYKDQFWHFLEQKVGKSFDEEKSLISLADYVSSGEKVKKSRNKIAVIYAVGGIDDGDSDGIDSEELAKTLADARKDKDIKAVVLRVNSPGGSAYGAEQIWREAFLYKKVKPLIVSMGDYAASGGYYIACTADSIVCQPSTITGSIGIFGVIPDFSGLTQKIGVDFDVQKTYAKSDFPTVIREMTPEEKQLMQLYVERGYDLFVKRCASGRSMSEDSIRVLARGRVWSGKDAVRNGLADKIGGLEDALKIAANKAKVKDYEVVSLPKQENFFMQLFEDSFETVETRMRSNFPVNEYKMIKKLSEQNFKTLIQARIEQETHIW